MKDFAKGEKVKLEMGGEVTIAEVLGSGGQGTVYKVNLNGKDYALKWYHVGSIKNPDEFKNNLRANIRRGAPDKKFLWPSHLTEERGGSFGYVMELRPKVFRDFSDILNAKDKYGNKVFFTSLHSMINAALNIVTGFRSLHIKGLSYQDLNDGNFFINVETGEVLICDNDNVAPDQVNFGIGGKPGYMAPEIVRGDTKPHALTDCHSLAVILFKLLVRHDPLMGTNYVNSVCITETKELELYGTKPVFIFDPNDASNRPVQGVHNNPIKLWPKYPKYIQNAFVQSFCEGMKNPNIRLPESEWQKLLIRLRDDIITCPCGNSVFINNMQFDASNAAACKNCGTKFSKPMKLKLKSFEINMFPKNKLYKCHTVENAEGSDDYMTETGEVVQNKSNPGLWGIRNVSQSAWTVRKPDGTTQSVAPSAVAIIEDNMEITFTNIMGKIQKS